MYKGLAKSGRARRHVVDQACTHVSLTENSMSDMMLTIFNEAKMLFVSALREGFDDAQACSMHFPAHQIRWLALHVGLGDASSLNVSSYNRNEHNF
jgi:hypothetical protein